MARHDYVRTCGRSPGKAWLGCHRKREVRDEARSFLAHIFLSTIIVMCEAQTLIKVIYHSPEESSSLAV